MTANVKICGLTTKPALDAALDAGADFIGLVFFPKSPRHLDLETAAELSAHARARAASVKVVALLVDPNDDFVRDVSANVRPDMLQLHGHETVERVMAIRRLANLPIMKAVSVGSAADVAGAQAFLAPSVADILLFDAKPSGDGALPGGNGLAFDWTILDGLDRQVPFALAGGLTPGNVAEAVRRTRAPIVDVSSGVESAPGVKDVELIRLFIKNAKTAK